MGIRNAVACGHRRVGVGKTTVDQQAIEYFRTRERIERAAAKAAATEAARRAHLELAQSYAALVQKG